MNDRMPFCDSGLQSDLFIYLNTEEGIPNGTIANQNYTNLLKANRQKTQTEFVEYLRTY